MKQIRVLAHPLLKDACDPELFRSLVDRFKQYKADGVRPVTFGRDVQYDRPPSIVDHELWHIHVKDASSAGWDLRHVRQFNMTSDSALVYCPGFWNPNTYLLIAFVVVAHNYYGGTEKYVRAWAAIAEKFREKY